MLYVVVFVDIALMRCSCRIRPLFSQLAVNYCKADLYEQFCEATLQRERGGGGGREKEKEREREEQAALKGRRPVEKVVEMNSISDMLAGWKMSDR